MSSIEGTISLTNLATSGDIGDHVGSSVNSHVDIDNHINDSNIHGDFSFVNTHISDTSIHQTNAQIDHNLTLNYVADEHLPRNDAGLSVNELWSSQKVSDELTNSSNAIKSDFTNTLSTGLLSGGAISNLGGSYNVNSGTGIIVNDATNSYQSVSWNAKNKLIAGTGQEYVCIDSGGNLITTPSPPTPQSRRDNICLGLVVFVGSVIVQVLNDEDYVYQPHAQLRDFARSIGLFNIQGNNVLGSGGMAFNKTFGQLHGMGSNYTIDAKRPNIVDCPSINTAVGGTFVYQLRNGNITNQFATLIDSNNYDNGGVLTVMSNNKFKIDRLFISETNQLTVLYGQAQYNDIAECETAILNVSVITPPNVQANTLLLAHIIVEKGATFLTDPQTCKIAQTSKFGESRVSGASSSGGGTLQEVYDASLPNPNITTTASINLTGTGDPLQVNAKSVEGHIDDASLHQPQIKTTPSLLSNTSMFVTGDVTIDAVVATTFSDFIALGATKDSSLGTKDIQLRIYTLKNNVPSYISKKSILTGANSFTPLKIEQIGNKIIMYVNNGNIYIINIDNPITPIVTETLTGVSGSFTVNGRYMYSGWVNGGNYYLRVHDLETNTLNWVNSSDPFLHAGTAKPKHMLTNGSYIFHSGVGNGFGVVDIVSNPTSPSLVAWNGVGVGIGTAQSPLALINNYLYISDSSNLYKVDISAITPSTATTTQISWPDPYFLKYMAVVDENHLLATYNTGPSRGCVLFNTETETKNATVLSQFNTGTPNNSQWVLSNGNLVFFKSQSGTYGSIASVDFFVDFQQICQSVGNLKSNNVYCNNINSKFITSGFITCKSLGVSADTLLDGNCRIDANLEVVGTITNDQLLTNPMTADLNLNNNKILQCQSLQIGTSSSNISRYQQTFQTNTLNVGGIASNQSCNLNYRRINGVVYFSIPQTLWTNTTQGSPQLFELINKIPSDYRPLSGLVNRYCYSYGIKNDILEPIEVEIISSDGTIRIRNIQPTGTAGWTVTALDIGKQTGFRNIEVSYHTI